MAQIPMGQFGQATVVPRPNRSGVDLSGTEAAGRAIAQAGQIATDVADQALRQSAAERAREQNEAEALARAKAANSVLSHELQTRSIVEGMQAEVADGSLDWRKAEEEYQARTAKLETPDIPDLDPVAAEQFRGGMMRNGESGRLQVQGLVAGARRSEFKTQFEQGLDTLGKIAGAPNADIEAINSKAEAFTPLARAAGVDPATIAAKVQAFKDRNWTNQAGNRLLGARDNLEALTALENDLTSEKGYYAGKLDTDKRNAILSQVLTAKGRLEAKAQHEADKGEAAASRTLAKFEAQVSSGIPAPIDVMTEWTETVKRGTPEQQAEFRGLIEQEVEIRRVLSRPPAEQQRYVAELQAKQQREGATLAQQANTKRLETAVATSVKQLRENPLGFHMERTGGTVAPLNIQAVLTGDFAPVQRQASERMTILQTMRKQYGDSVGNSPLMPEEAAALSAAMARSSTNNTLVLFGTLNKAFGDPTVYQAAMRQIAPNSPVRAAAGAIYAMQRETWVSDIAEGSAKASSGDVAKLMLQGEAVLAKKDGGTPFPMPAPKEFSDAFARKVGEVFRGRPAAYQSALQTVRAFYAGTASRDGDVKGELNADRLQQAVEAVLGEPVAVNGEKVLPPWGMDESEFKEKIEAQWDSVINKIPEPLSRDMDDYTIVQRVDGEYQFYDKASGKFLGLGSKPLTLRVK